jgi:hypothetical protein
VEGKRESNGSELSSVARWRVSERVSEREREREIERERERER